MTKGKPNPFAKLGKAKGEDEVKKGQKKGGGFVPFKKGGKK